MKKGPDVWSGPFGFLLDSIVQEGAGMKQPEPLVVIAGAGPVGLALALGLERQGVHVLVLEERPSPNPHSRAPALWPRSLEILRQYGVWDGFRAVGRLMTRLEAHVVGREAPVAHIDLGLLADETATPGVLIIPQNDTEALLLRALRHAGRTEVRQGHSVIGLEQDADGVTVQVRSLEGIPYDLRCAYLVGCDGAHSAVRHALGWHLEGKTYPTRLMLADVRLGDARNELPWPRLMAHGRGGYGALRIRDDLWRMIATIEPGVSDEELEAEPLVREQVDALFGAGPYELLWSSVFHIHCRTSPHFREGRVLLAGDAAHLNSPAFGMGMNSGIQDAHNLAWKLARAIQGGDAEPLLASYEAERRPVIVQTIDRFTDLATRVGLLARPRIRTWVARLLNAALGRPALRRAFVTRMAMFDHHYRHSPLITGDGAFLGDRAPDREVMDGDGRFVRLYDMVGPHAVLLLFDDGRFPLWRPGQVENWMAGLPGIRVVRVLPRGAQPSLGWYWDAEGELYEAWHATPGTAALIRPDLVVGWREELPTQEALLRGVEIGLGVARQALPAEPPVF